MRKITIILAIILLVCTGCGIEPSQNSVQKTVPVSAQSNQTSMQKTSNTVSAQAAVTPDTTPYITPTPDDHPLSSWSEELVLTYNGYVYDVTNEKTKDYSTEIGKISYRGGGQFYELYSIKYVDDYSKIAVRTSDGYLVAIRTSEKAAQPTVVTPEPSVKTPEPKNYTLSSDSAILKNGLKISDMEKYFVSNNGELVKKLGDSYKVMDAGAEGTNRGYYYGDLGLTLVFSSDGSDEPLLWIEFDADKLDLGGLTADMNFKQLQAVLGKGTVTKKR